MVSFTTLSFLLTITQVLALPSLTTVPTYTLERSSIHSRSNAATLTVLVCADSTNTKCSKTPDFPVKQCQSVSDNSGGCPNLQWDLAHKCDIFEERNCPSKGKKMRNVEGPGINVLADGAAIAKGITKVGSFKCYQDKSKRNADTTEL